MSNIINSYGYNECVTTIVLQDLNCDGTIYDIAKHLFRNKEYRITYWDAKQRALLDVNGIFIDTSTDPCNCNQNEIDVIVIDVSREFRSDKLRIRVKDIKYIQEIKQFRGGNCNGY